MVSPSFQSWQVEPVEQLQIFGPFTWILRAFQGAFSRAGKKNRWSKHRIAEACSPAVDVERIQAN